MYINILLYYELALNNIGNINAHKSTNEEHRGNLEVSKDESRVNVAGERLSGEIKEQYYKFEINE